MTRRRNALHALTPSAKRRSNKSIGLRIGHSLSYELTMQTLPQ